MAEYRLAKVASELNRSTSAIAEFLKEKGYSIEVRPTTKITDDMYQECLKEFSADKAAKLEAEKLKSPKPLRPSDLQINEAQSTTAVNNPEPVAKTAPPVEKKEEVSAPVTTVTPNEENEVEKVAVVPDETPGIKVIGKIDLTPKNKSSKPAETIISEKTEEIKKTEEAPKVVVEPKIEVIQPQEEKVIETKPIPVAETKTEPEKPVEVEKTVETINVPVENQSTPAPTPVEEKDDEIEKVEMRKEVLSGPKVVGRINLPVEKTGNSTLAQAARKDMQEIRKKRKR